MRCRHPDKLDSSPGPPNACRCPSKWESIAIVAQLVWRLAICRAVDVQEGQDWIKIYTAHQTNTLYT